MGSSQQQEIVRRLVCDRRPLDTNPVYCFHLLWPDKLPDLQILREVDFRFPAHFLSDLSKQGIAAVELKGRLREPPGVVGLLASGDTGLVVPLRARRSEEWSVPANLPFPSEVLQDALTRLFRARGLALARLQPHLFPFRFEDTSAWRSEGSSMTIAGVLAVMAGAAAEQPPFLKGAVAVVQPEGDSLKPVEHIPVKLEAFCREFDRGTLLVRTKDCPEAEAFRSYFDDTWEVDSLAELGRHLDARRLLAPFRDLKPLDRHHFERALEWIRVLVDRQHRCRDALEHLEELQHASLAHDIPRPIYAKLGILRMDAYRHQGLYDKALDDARQWVQQLDERPEWSSFEEQIRAAVVYAASLYDPHYFDEIEPFLRPWVERIREECRLVTPEARIWLWNTFARGRIIRGGDWEGPLRDSLELQRELDPFQVPRTCCYLIHGYLRHGRLEEAANTLRDAETNLLGNDFSQWILRFLQADLARQRGEIWIAPDVESQSVARTHLAHPFGFYFQATARQRGRSVEDARGRFDQARQYFLAEMSADDERNITAFLAESMALAQAGWQGDDAGWNAAMERLQRFAEHPSARGVAAYYAPIWPRLATGPSPEAAEILLRRVPFF